MPCFKNRSAKGLVVPVLIGSFLTVGVMGFAAANPAPLEQSLLPTKLQYSSAMRNYRPYAEQSAGGWREANDLVETIGGWRAYAKEIQTEKPTDNVVPKSSPHQGHEGNRK